MSLSYKFARIDEALMQDNRLHSAFTNTEEFLSQNITPLRLAVKPITPTLWDTFANVIDVSWLRNDARNGNSLYVVADVVLSHPCVVVFYNQSLGDQGLTATHKAEYRKLVSRTIDSLIKIVGSPLQSGVTVCGVRSAIRATSRSQRLTIPQVLLRLDSFSHPDLEVLNGLSRR